MMKCVNEDCQYFREHGEYSEECIKRGIKKIVTNAEKFLAQRQIGHRTIFANVETHYQGGNGKCP